ncbi:TetR/AcrR family transcriptional regulator [Streptosporangium saharense]|uniref:TetR/AcrR family transcriptional regulator n=1 Tax=Streptosporangium saharense TaxID=1706840 RepID=UPI00342544D0
MATTGRRLRADAERSVRTILEAAERLLSENPGATMEQIAEAAGVARTTVHRRFASREALVETMATSAWQEIDDAVDAARPYTAPPLVAMHQATANVVQIKSGWRFALGTLPPPGEEATRIHDEVMAKCDAVFARALEAGLLRPGTDPRWARQVYLALISEAVHCAPAAAQPQAADDPDALATLIIDTLLYGLAPRRPGPPAVQDTPGVDLPAGHDRS